MNQSNRDRGRNRGYIKAGLDLIMNIRGHFRYNQNFRGRSTYSPNNRGRYGYNTRGNQRYTRNNNYGRGRYRDQNYSRGVGHLKDRIEVGEITEAWVTVGLCQVLEWVWIEREFDALSVESMIIVQCPVRLARETSREAKQIQQMFNMDKDQTLVQTLLMDTDKDEPTITLVDTRGNLNL